MQPRVLLNEGISTAGSFFVHADFQLDQFPSLVTAWLQEIVQDRTRSALLVLAQPLKKQPHLSLSIHSVLK